MPDTSQVLRMKNPLSSNPIPNPTANPTFSPAQFFNQDKRLAYSIKVGELVGEGLRGEELEAEIRRWMAERREQEREGEEARSRSRL
jgi:hypothetical protein